MSLVALDDGRACAAENGKERTGAAVGAELFGTFRALGDAPAAVSPDSGGGLRYVDVLALPGGAYRLYYEITRGDGAHELRTELVAVSAVDGGSQASQDPAA